MLRYTYIASLVFVVFSGSSGLCDELITPSEESYRICVCLNTRDLETSAMRWPRPDLRCCDTENDLFSYLPLTRAAQYRRDMAIYCLGTELKTARNTVTILFSPSQYILKSVRGHITIVLTVTINGMHEIHPMIYLLY
jgi:hypothetical protein